MNTLLHYVGLDNPNGTPYLFWSGISTHIDRLAVLGLAWHHFNCHQHGCWRVGRRSHQHYCRRHHQPET